MYVNLKWTKNRVALRTLDISKADKSRLLAFGLAQRIFYGSGAHGYRLYTTPEIAAQLSTGGRGWIDAYEHAHALVDGVRRAGSDVNTMVAAQQSI